MLVLEEQLLVCCRCQSTKPHLVNEKEIWPLDLYCDVCSDSTGWTPAGPAQARANDDKGVNMDAYAELARVIMANKPRRTDFVKEVWDVLRRERRSIRRAPLELPVRIRLKDVPGVEEFTNTVNIARGGIFVLSQMRFRPGQRVMVAMNCQPGRSIPVEQAGIIVRITRLPDCEDQGVAIRFL
jgi:hypothetical protein